jgi:2-polyprenyl-3-methyl-5-hydroxy-6-metoxy-1,4-benzoquinol methylase
LQGATTATACPLCGGTLFERVHARVADFEHGLPSEADFSACSSCGLVWQNPQPSLEALHSFYPDDYRPHVSGSAAGGGGTLGWLKGIQSRQLLAQYARWLPADRGKAIVDLGCGSGRFLQALHDGGYHNLTGVDRNPRLAAAFEGTSIRFIATELEPDFQLEGRYQAIVMNYVLEHFLDPLAVLGRCRESLEPSGRVLLLTPNVDSWAHSVFGRYWSGLHAPRHTQLFSASTLEVAAKKAGFDRTEVSPVVDPASWAFSLQNWIRSRFTRQGVARGTAWYGLASLPLLYPVAAAERFAGKSASLIACLSIR